MEGLYTHMRREHIFFFGRQQGLGGGSSEVEDSPWTHRHQGTRCADDLSASCGESDC